MVIIIFGYWGCLVYELENLLVGFCYVLIYGVEGIEIDLYLIKDGVLVIIYDEILYCIINGIGQVVDYILVELW